MDDLEALFEGVEGIKDDLLEYGTIAVAAVGSNILVGLGADMLYKSWTSAPVWVRQWGTPVATFLLGLLGGPQVAKLNREIGLGLGVGLMANGVAKVLGNIIPSLPSGAVAGLSDGNDQVLLGAGPDLFQKYLAAAPLTVEEKRNFGMAPVTVQEQNAFGNVPLTVTEVGTFGSLASADAMAALQ